NMTQVVVGAPRHPAWLRLLLRSTADDRVRDAGDIDTHIVSGGKDDAADEPEGRGQGQAELPERRIGPQPREEAWPIAQAYRQSALVVVACSLVAALMVWAGLSEANVIMVYLLGVVWVAARWGRAPAAAFSVVSVLTFDFF